MGHPAEDVYINIKKPYSFRQRLIHVETWNTVHFSTWIKLWVRRKCIAWHEWKAQNYKPLTRIYVFGNYKITANNLNIMFIQIML